MLKSILNLEGAQGLSKNEQKRITGGSDNPALDCALAGGQWTCVGITPGVGLCGCVDSYPTNPIKIK